MSGAAAATFYYDGDGNRVKGTIGGVTTTYIGNYFEWTSSTTTMKKYYYAGATRVVMRTGASTINYLLGDQLGSTSITTNSSGVRNAEVRYNPWGSDRYTSGTTPTTFKFTGQRAESGLGLYYYGARWYDAYLNRWIQPDTIIPDPYNSQAWDRFTYVYNNPLRYIDPTGHRTCTDKQAATGDETCDQNYNADDLQKALDFFYGWKVAGEWDVEELVLILEAGQSIREFIAVNTGEDGNLWIKTYLGNTVFHHGNEIRSFVFPSSDAYLRNGEERYWVVHELGHVLDNNLKGGGGPATFFGGGAADAMLKFVGGNPENCFPRFQCSSSYIKDIAGPESWGQGEYGNNSVADDFAQTFARVTTNGIAPTLRSIWMKAFLGVLASYVP